MKRFVVAAIVPLIVSFGVALTSAMPASAATPTCGGTSLEQDSLGNMFRVPTVLNAHPNEFDCNLGPGSPTVPVMRLQIDLNDCHGGNLSVDGSYGPLTMAAVKRVQAAEGLPASEQDGLYGPITIDGLADTVGIRDSFSYADQTVGCDFLNNP